MRENTMTAKQTRAIRELKECPHVAVSSWERGDIAALRRYVSRRTRKFLSQQAQAERADLAAKVQDAKVKTLTRIVLAMTEEERAAFFKAVKSTYGQQEP
jgi:predicted lipid-binding transport protein (Tim44 family)